MMVCPGVVNQSSCTAKEPETNRTVFQRSSWCSDLSTSDSSTVVVELEPSVSKTTAQPSSIAPPWRERDEEFWFEDGTVILVAGGIEFRIYSGLLAAHSPVFRDLLAKPNPTRSDPSDGTYGARCPIVHLSDSPEDLRHLLRACFPKRLGRFVNRVSLHNAQSC